MSDRKIEIRIVRDDLLIVADCGITLYVFEDDSLDISIMETTPDEIYEALIKFRKAVQA